FYLLGGAPEAQARLRAELDEVLDGRLPGAADLPRLRYTKAVFHESMRLYPPAWMLARRLITEREVCGHRLPAGAMLGFSSWGVRGDGLWGRGRERFKPERWRDEEPGRPRYAYSPWGGGPRQCIGNGFAEAEGVLALATLCGRWHVAPASPEPVLPRPLVTL